MKLADDCDILITGYSASPQSDGNLHNAVENRVPWYWLVLASVSNALFVRRAGAGFEAHLSLSLSLSHTLFLTISLSLRSMWLQKRLSGVAVSRRGFQRLVSIATHSSSWALLPTHPFCCHTASLSSPPTPPANHPPPLRLRWNGHRVDPLGLLLLQPLREIKPTWVCFLSVCLSPSDCLPPPPPPRSTCLSLPLFCCWISQCFHWNAFGAVFLVFAFILVRATCWLRPNKWDGRLKRERPSGRKGEIETDRAHGLGSSQMSGSNLFQWSTLQIRESFDSSAAHPSFLWLYAEISFALPFLVGQLIIYICNLSTIFFFMCLCVLVMQLWEI